MKKNITHFFEHDLGAPLNNPQWSWGAVDGLGRVFLRVWQSDWEHQKRRVLAFAPGWERSAGHNERISQLTLIEGGARGFLVSCEGERDESTGKMSIKRFREDVVFPIQAIERVGDQAFARWLDPVDVGSLMR